MGTAPLTATVAGDTARGPLTPRLTTAGVGMDVATHTARGPLMPSPLLSLRPSPRPGTAMATARGPLMPMPTTAMAVAMDTDTARGPLMLMPTTAGETMDVVTPTARGPLMPTTVPATAMAVTAHTTDKLQQTVSKREDTSEIKPKFVWCFQKCQELI